MVFFGVNNELMEGIQFWIQMFTGAFCWNGLSLQLMERPVTYNLPPSAKNRVPYKQSVEGFFNIFLV